MPFFYIDTDDGASFVLDDEGRNLADVEAARALAQRALVEMAHQLLPNGERRTFTAAIRDKIGTALYVATLTFSGEWKVPPRAA